MSLEEHIFNHLKDSASLSELVGARIYPVRVPDNAQWPCIRYQVVSGFDHTTFAGISRSRESRVQFDVLGKRYADVIATKKRLIEAFKTYSGTAQGSTIQGAQLAMDVDDVWSEETTLYRRIVTFELLHLEIA